MYMAIRVSGIARGMNHGDQNPFFEFYIFLPFSIHGGSI